MKKERPFGPFLSHCRAGILSIMHGCEIGTNAILIRGVVVVRIAIVVDIRKVRRRN